MRFSKSVILRKARYYDACALTLTFSSVFHMTISINKVDLNDIKFLCSFHFSNPNLSDFHITDSKEITVFYD